MPGMFIMLLSAIVGMNMTLLLPAFTYMPMYPGVFFQLILISRLRRMPVVMMMFHNRQLIWPLKADKNNNNEINLICSNSFLQRMIELTV